MVRLSKMAESGNFLVAYRISQIYPVLISAALRGKVSQQMGSVVILEMALETVLVLGQHKVNKVFRGAALVKALVLEMVSALGQHRVNKVLALGTVLALGQRKVNRVSRVVKALASATVLLRKALLAEQRREVKRQLALKDALNQPLVLPLKHLQQRAKGQLPR